MIHLATYHCRISTAYCQYRQRSSGTHIVLGERPAIMPLTFGAEILNAFHRACSASRIDAYRASEPDAYARFLPG